MFTVHSLIPFVSRRGLRRGVPAVCAALLAAGCTSESLDGGGAGGSASGPEAWMTLSLAMPQQAAVRANTPAGGEQGDGAEAGQQAENVINRAVAFFYQGAEGPNSSPGTPILATADFSFASGSGMPGTEPVDRKYTTQPQRVSLKSGTYHVLLIANPGTDWWSALQQGGSLTLGSVRDHIQSSAWTEPQEGTFADFVMTSERDASVALNNNPRTSPATATVYVERMAARVDYKAQGPYTCKDEPYKGATVSIVGAALVNNLTAGSYVLKRVSPDATASPVSYLGLETADATTGAGTNYVIDPYTTQKSDPAVKQYYGTWYADYAKPDADSTFWSSLTQRGTALEGADNAGYLRIGYTLENTAAPADSAGRTGIVFRAQFAPQGVTGYTQGQTFFTYGGVIYASVERLMTAVYGTASPVEKIFTTADTWKTVRDYAAATLLPSDPSDYPKWLAKQAEGKDDATALTADEAARLGWKAYMRAECGYENTPEAGGADRVAINLGGVNTRAVLRSGGVRTYDRGQCYYTYWLRHAADGDNTKASPMEYAVVRNNVYKVDVKSIYSLGGDVPGEDDHNLVIEVYVNDWRLLPTEALPM